MARLVWVMLTMRPRQEARMSPMPARVTVTSTEARNPGGSRCRGSALWGLQLKLQSCDFRIHRNRNM